MAANYPPDDEQVLDIRDPGFQADQASQPTEAQGNHGGAQSGPSNQKASGLEAYWEHRKNNAQIGKTLVKAKGGHVSDPIYTYDGLPEAAFYEAVRNEYADRNFDRAPWEARARGDDVRGVGGLTMPSRGPQPVPKYGSLLDAGLPPGQHMPAPVSSAATLPLTPSRDNASLIQSAHTGITRSPGGVVTTSGGGLISPQIGPQPAGVSALTLASPYGTGSATRGGPRTQPSRINWSDTYDPNFNAQPDAPPDAPLQTAPTPGPLPLTPSILATRQRDSEGVQQRSPVPTTPAPLPATPTMPVPAPTVSGLPPGMMPSRANEFATNAATAIAGTARVAALPITKAVGAADNAVKGAAKWGFAPRPIPGTASIGGGAASLMGPGATPTLAAPQQAPKPTPPKSTAANTLPFPMPGAQIQQSGPAMPFPMPKPPVPMAQKRPSFV
jgi:hypothetical protein